MITLKRKVKKKDYLGGKMGNKFKQQLQSFADAIFVGGQVRLIEASEEDKRMIKELGVKFPNPDLALFEGVYLLADVANKNRHFLSSDTVEKAVSTIKMKPTNYFHKREQPIGVYLNGTYDKTTKSMRTVGILWRSLFPDQVKVIEDLIRSGNSGQSFELTYQKSGVRPDTSIELFDVTFKGGAILPRDKAACSDSSADVLAKVLQDESVVMGGITQTEKGGEKTMTIEEILIAEGIYVEVLGNENTTPEEFDKNLEWLHINEEESVEYSADAAKLTYQQRQELPDSSFAYVKEVKGKKVRRFPIYDEVHVKNALARLPQAKGLSTAEKAGIKAKVLRKAKSLGMKDLIERHKSEACFTYEDVTSFMDEVTQTYANHIAPEKLEEVIAERVKKFLEDKAKAEQEIADKAAKYAEYRKMLPEFTDEELKAYDLLDDGLMNNLVKDNKIRELEKKITLLEKPQGSAQGAEETPEQKTAREAKEAADKVEADKVAKEKADADKAKADKDAADKIEADRVAKETADKEAKEKADKDMKEKEAKEAKEKKEKEDADGKLLTHGIPKVDESVKSQMRDVTQKQGE